MCFSGQKPLATVVVDGGNRDKHDFVTSSFLYSRFDQNAKTIIIVKSSYHEREYNVDLSRIK